MCISSSRVSSLLNKRRPSWSSPKHILHRAWFSPCFLHHKDFDALLSSHPSDLKVTQVPTVERKHGDGRGTCKILRVGERKPGPVLGGVTGRWVRGGTPTLLQRVCVSGGSVRRQIFGSCWYATNIPSRVEKSGLGSGNRRTGETEVRRTTDRCGSR